MNFNKVGILEIDGNRLGFRPIEVEFSGNSHFTPIRGELFSLSLTSNSIGIGHTAIKKVIFNDPATIVIWNDGTKTVVKCQEGDTYSKELGLAMCISKKYLGNKGNFNEEFKKWIPAETLVNDIDDIKRLSEAPYPLGTKIKIIDAGSGAYGVDGKSGRITDLESSHGLLPTDLGYNVLLDNGSVWRIRPEAKIEILKNKED